MNKNKDQLELNFEKTQNVELNPLELQKIPDEAPELSWIENESSDSIPEQKPIKKLNIVFFDLETQNLISDFNVVNFSHLKMSVGVTYNTLHEAYNTYTEQNVDSLIHELLVADAIVGFNHKQFDYEVLSVYMSQTAFDNLKKVKSLDIYLYLLHKLGHRISLDSVVKATLGAKKTATGVQAVEWYREGKIDLITEYCKNDVQVTKELYEFGCEHSYVCYVDKYSTETKPISVDWSLLKNE